MDASSLIYLGLAAIILGFLLVAAGALFSALSGSEKTQVRGGGVVFIGPIPILFGTDKGSVVSVALLSLAVMVAFYLLFYRRGGV